MPNLKTMSLLATIAAATAVSTTAGFAQNEQVIDQLQMQMTELGMAESEMEKLQMATDEQLAELTAILDADTDEQAKEDQARALLDQIQ